MRNVLVLGCGRSGTSMAASLFASGPYYFGDDLISSGPANPRGYYEDRGINSLNDELIHTILRKGYISRILYKVGPAVHRRRAALWLAAPFRLPKIDVPDRLVTTMRHHLAHRPYCLKDPRFTYTLQHWRPYLAPDTRYLVVFRDAPRTVDSILRDAVESYTPPLPISRSMGYFTWYCQYRRLLALADDEWLFVSYDQITSGSCAELMDRFFETQLDFSVIDRRLSRAKQDLTPQIGLRGLCRSLYNRLLQRASYDAARIGQA